MKTESWKNISSNQPDFNKRTEGRIVFSVIFLVICGTLGIDIHIATLPAIMKFMGTDKAHVQHLVPIYIFGIGLSVLFYGPLSDKYGRKPVVLIGLVVASLASFASCLAREINFLIVMRFIQGFGCGVCYGLGRTIFADVFSGQRMAILAAQFAMFISLSPMFAPTIGGYIQHIWNWQANFLVLGIFILLAAIVYAVFCPETNVHKNPHAIKPRVIYSHYKEIMSNHFFLVNTVLSGLVASISMVYLALSPFIFQLEFHLTAIEYSWIAGFLGLVGFIARFITIGLLKHYGRIFQLKLNSVIFLLAGVTMFILQQLACLDMITIIILVAVMIFAQTAVAPTFSSYALKVFPEKAGVAGSIFSSGQMLISFATSSIASSFSTGGVNVLSMSYLLIAIIIAKLILTLLRSNLDA